MKRLAFIFLFFILFVSSYAAVFAQGPSELDRRLNTILPSIPGVVNQDPSKGVGSLPRSDLKTQIIPQAIRIFLMFVGSVSFIIFVYAGIMLVIAQGNEEEITKFKNILIWSLIGLLFITLSYGIVSGIMRLSFT